MDDLERLLGPWLLDDVPSGKDAWPAVEAWIGDAVNPVTVFAGDTLAGERALWQLGLTSASVLGAIALHTSGIWIDRGWVRIHGPRLLTQSPLDPRQGLLIAHDAVGGRFALDHGGIAGVAGEVVYQAPGGLEWQSMDRPLEDWLRWLLDADLRPFYAEFRWPGWELELMELSGDDGIRLSPAPWSGDAWSAAAARRERVSVSELLALAGVPPAM
jgi:hypothetical protein